MTAAQRRALNELLPRYQIPSDTQSLELTTIFGNANPVILEIGFGNGTLLAQQADAHPDKNFIGIEVHRPGIGRLLRQISANGSANIRIMVGDAVEILSRQFTPCALSAVWVFFPDPWPKKQHHKRRLVKSDFLQLAAQTLQPQGILHLATDWRDYAQQIRNNIIAEPRLTLATQPPTSTYPFIRPTTHFESRGRGKGHQINDIYAINQ